MRIGFRIVIVGLLAIIALDMTDASCDPVRIQGDRPVVSAPEEHAGDPCSAQCVPDCFCCSSTLVAVPVFSRGPLDLLPGVPVIVLSRLAQGIPTVQDHVPKSTL